MLGVSVAGIPSMMMGGGIPIIVKVFSSVFVDDGIEMMVAVSVLCVGVGEGRDVTVTVSVGCVGVEEGVAVDVMVMVSSTEETEYPESIWRTDMVSVTWETPVITEVVTISVTSAVVGDGDRDALSVLVKSLLSVEDAGNSDGATRAAVERIVSVVGSAMVVALISVTVLSGGGPGSRARGDRLTTVVDGYTEVTVTEIVKSPLFGSDTPCV